jgi:hypothetical protein
LEEGKYAQNKTMEIWEDGRQIGFKQGTYKHDDEDEYR